MKRIATAVVALPILLYTVWSSVPYFFVVLVAAATLLGLGEFYNLAARTGSKPSTVLGYSAALLVLGCFVFERPAYAVPVFATLGLGALATGLLQADEMSKALASAGATLLGVTYVALLAGYLVGVRMLEDQRGIPHLAPKLLTMFLAMVMLTDTGAYYTGRAFGRHKLSPKISPGKTVEGGIGGLAAGIAAGPLSHLIFFHELPIIHALILGGLVSAVGQVGDLAESMLKRGANVKDSSHLLPGHGGMLDRLDSILFAAPLVYYYASFLLAGR